MTRNTTAPTTKIAPPSCFGQVTVDQNVFGGGGPIARSFRSGSRCLENPCRSNHGRHGVRKGEGRGGTDVSLPSLSLSRRSSVRSLLRTDHHSLVGESIT